MRRFLLDGLVKPLAALAFLLGFGGVWVFIAFESVTVSLARSADGREEHKRGLVRQIEAYIRGDGAGPFTAEFRLRHLARWFGVPFFVLGLIGLVAWPWTVVKACRTTHPPAGRRAAA